MPSLCACECGEGTSHPLPHQKTIVRLVLRRPRRVRRVRRVRRRRRPRRRPRVPQVGDPGDQRVVVSPDERVCGV